MALDPGYAAEQADHDDDPGISLHSVSCNDPDCPVWEGAGECMDPGEYEQRDD